MVLQLDDAISPFLNVFKDGRLVDSFCLDGRDSIVLGRHTNSDVLLTHPSISRHHLEIQLLHATRELLLTDMGSVHGTWIDGKQLPPRTPVTVKEGEAIKLGASSRTYRVHWLPHPLPASSNKMLTNMKEEADSELSNTRRMVLMQACSTKSIETCTERNRTGPRAPANKSNDPCNENSRTEQFPLQIPKLERCASLCLKREAMSPHMVQEISVAAGSANGIETFNANINLHISQQQQHKGGLPPLPPASRRIPFAPLQSNTITPIVKKRISSTRKRLVSRDSVKSTTKQVMEGENLDSGSKLRFQHCNSAPSPMLDTTVSALQSSALSPLAEKRFTQALTTCNVNTITSEVPSAQRPLSIKTPKSNIDEKQNQIIKPRENLQQLSDGENTSERQLVINLQDKGENGGSDQGADLVGFLSRCSSLDESTIAEEYASDKENQGPVLDVGKLSTGGVFNRLQAGSCAGGFSAATELSRRPFQPLILTPNGVYRSGSRASSTYAQEDSFLARLHSRPSSVVQNLVHMLPKLKGMAMAKSQTRREWHIVIDSTCLMDPNSFKGLKLLEGIREVRLIIPQIVIRELDFCKRKDKTCMSPNAVLKWIESCMVKFPSWIHVQNSSENVRVGVTTPPASPCHGHPASLIYGGTFGDLMSPTTGDHVLNCALVFSTAVFDGEVALLTNDTALKIKAMAEGILCESATTFCGSLLSPYSERFLWVGSIAHGAQKSYHSTPEFPIRIFAEPKRTIISAARGMTSKKHQVLEGLKNHCKQAQGLKVILNH